MSSIATSESFATLRTYDKLQDDLAQRQREYADSQDLSAARAAADAMKAIAQHRITPEVVAYLIAVLSATVARAPWNFTDAGEMVQDGLNAAHDDLVYMVQQ